MARYFAVHLDASHGWKTIPEKLGNISVATTISGKVTWKPAKQVDVYTGHAWQTVWKIVPPHVDPHPPTGGGTTTPTTHTTHTATATVHKSGTTATWSIPSGRHVIRQTLTYYTSRVGGTIHTVTVPVSRHGATVTVGAWGLKLTYVYR